MNRVYSQYEVRLGQIRAMVRTKIAEIQSEVSHLLRPFEQDAQTVMAGLERLIGAGLQTVVNIVKNHGDQIRKDIGDTFKHGYDVVVSIMEPLAGTVRQALDSISEFVENHQQEIDSAFGETWSTAMDIVNTAMDIFQQIIAPNLRAAQLWFWQFHDNIQLAFQGAFQFIHGIVTGVMGAIAGVLHTVLAAMRGDWQGTLNGLKEIASSIFNGLHEVILGFFNVIASIFGTNMETITKTWNDNFTTLLVIAYKLGRMINEAIQEKLAELIKLWNDAWAAAEKAWGEFAEKAKALGKNFAGGILKGLEEMANELYEKAKNLASGLLHAAEEALRTGSPSEETTDRIGEPYVTGIFKGIERAMPALLQGIAGLGKKMVEAMQKIGDEAAKALQDSINAGFSADTSISQRIVQNVRSIQGLAMSETDYRSQLEELQKDPSKRADAARLTEVYNQQKQVQQQAQDAINQAEATANELAKTDAESASKFYGMRSEQILRMADLQNQLGMATSPEERGQIQRIIEAQTRADQAETAEFEHDVENRSHRFDDIRGQINDQIGVAQRYVAALQAKAANKKDPKGQRWAQAQLPGAIAALEQLQQQAAQFGGLDNSNLGDYDLPSSGSPWWQSGQGGNNGQVVNLTMNLHTAAPYEQLMAQYQYMLSVAQGQF
jgi:hypothetical protein